MQNYLTLAALIVGGYLLGSIPFGVILTRLFGAGDLRQIGSGNIGATNVLRTGRKGLAAATLILDGAKGAVAALLAAHFAPQYGDTAPMLAGAAAFIGHCYPVWLKFKGGKGVATLLGLSFAFAWPIGLAFAATWLLAVLVTRISSLGGLIGSVAAPVTAFAIGEHGFVTGLAALVVLVFWRHRENLVRLRAGTEPRIGGNKSKVSEAERFAALQLLRTPGVGPVSWRQLLLRFGSAIAAAQALPDLAARGGKRLALANPRGIEAELARVAALGARHIFQTDADYPALLAQIEGAPAAVIIRGDIALTIKPTLAMVGARNASAIACRFARQIAAELAREGVTIVSGLARGIDTAAHVGAMTHGATIGVIGSGIDIAFPPENEDLQEQLATTQLLIAEEPPGTQPLARHFPARNRIIAGLALGTLVVEAAPKSGSLITARRAAECGREVMAVPGSPLDPRAQGCNLLIREGATLVQSAADVLEMLRPIDARMLREPGRDWRHDGADMGDDADDADRRRIAGLLGPVPVPVDELVRQSGCAASVVSLVLLELELAGRLERHAGGRVSAA